jgi:DNA-binding transcriptional MocR family regulator
LFINIDPSSGLPIYLQIAQQIKTAVAMGRLQPEEPLPSVRQLAVELAVNPNTVARAYLDLEIEGVNLGLSERELRDAFERMLEKIMQARAPEAVGR